MTRLDRYFLMQIFGPLGFFALALVGILWLAQAMPLIDRVIENGQSSVVFIQITTMLIPRVVSVVLPVSGFAATLYALNKFHTESELVVMMSAGMSPWRLARPVFVFGLVITAMMYVVTLYLVPASISQMNSQLRQIETQVTSTLLREGQFMHLDDRLTLYVRDTSRQGEMAGVFLNDSRNPAEPVTYTAQRALLISNQGGARIVLVNGMIERYQIEGRTLATIRFDRLSLDVDKLIPEALPRRRPPYEMYLSELLYPSAEDIEAGFAKPAIMRAEAADKLAQPLSGLVLPLIALATVLVGGFRRGGFAGRIALAAVIGLVVQSGVSAMRPFVQAAPDYMIIAAVPSIAGLIFAMVLLHFAGKNSRRRKVRAT